MKGDEMKHGRLRAWMLAPLILGLAAQAGCSGGEGNESAFTPIAGGDSAYCHTYRAWKVHELDGGEGFDQPDPAGLRSFWNAYLIAQETMLQQAPRLIRDEVEVKVRYIRTRLTPLMEKYDFDLERMQRDGSVAEREAIFQAPPPDVQTAQAAQYAYEDRTCGTAPSPPAADVVFEAGQASMAFCEALSVLNSELETVTSSRFDPNVMRALVTSDRFTEVLDGLDDTAPAAIAADVKADTEWFRTRWSDVMARYGYDLRGIYLDGTPEELAVFNRSHPDVLEHTSRTTAYEEQVCGG
jgi:hypothetical protein